MCFIKQSVLMKSSSSDIDLRRIFPDNYTVGTQEYYREKTKDRLPSHMYEIQELQALESDPDKVRLKLSQIRGEYMNQYSRIIASLENDIPK